MVASIYEAFGTEDLTNKSIEDVILIQNCKNYDLIGSYNNELINNNHNLTYPDNYYWPKTTRVNKGPNSKISKIVTNILYNCAKTESDLNIKKSEYMVVLLSANQLNAGQPEDVTCGDILKLLPDYNPVVYFNINIKEFVNFIQHALKITASNGENGYEYCPNYGGIVINTDHEGNILRIYDEILRDSGGISYFYKEGEKIYDKNDPNTFNNKITVITTSTINNGINNEKNKKIYDFSKIKIPLSYITINDKYVQTKDFIYYSKGNNYITLKTLYASELENYNDDYGAFDTDMIFDGKSHTNQFLRITED